jgi:hypothetical protein
VLACFRSSWSRGYTTQNVATARGQTTCWLNRWIAHHTRHHTTTRKGPASHARELPLQANLNARKLKLKHKAMLNPLSCVGKGKDISKGYSTACGNNTRNSKSRYTNYTQKKGHHSSSEELSLIPLCLRQWRRPCLNTCSNQRALLEKPEGEKHQVHVLAYLHMPGFSDTRAGLKH